MSGQLLRQRSRLAREDAEHALEVGVQQVANLVLNASALADRMEARPPTDLDEARARRDRVRVLRDAARAGQEAIGRTTAHLAGEPGADAGRSQR